MMVSQVKEEREADEALRKSRTPLKTYMPLVRTVH
jgi:hypothetical protein